MASARARLLRTHHRRNPFCSFLCRSPLPDTSRILFALFVLVNVVVSCGGVVDAVAVVREDGGGEGGGEERGRVRREVEGMTGNSGMLPDPSVTEEQRPPLQQIHKRSVRTARQQLRPQSTRRRGILRSRLPNGAGHSILLDSIRPRSSLYAAPGVEPAAPSAPILTPRRSVLRRRWPPLVRGGEGRLGRRTRKLTSRRRLFGAVSGDDRTIDEVIKAAYDQDGSDTYLHMKSAVERRGIMLDGLDLLLTPPQYKYLLPLRGRQKRKAVSVPQWTWPGGVVPFQFSYRIGRGQRDLILEAMRIWEVNTCVRFRPATSSDTDFVFFTENGNGCSSYLGKRGGRQPINLGPRCYRSDIILHELGHAVGLIHEHQRPDRDQFVMIQLDSVATSFRNQFRKFSSSVVSTAVPYDYTSIMHYGKTAFSDASQGKYSIITTDPSAQNIIGTARTLSQRDILAVRLLYGCGTGPISPPGQPGPVIIGDPDIDAEDAQDFALIFPPLSGNRLGKAKAVGAAGAAARGAAESRPALTLGLLDVIPQSSYRR